MADEEITNSSSDDMPAMDTMPEFEVGAGGPPSTGGVPGLHDLLMQPNSNQGGMWSPVQKLMSGSTKPEEYLALTDVNEEDIPIFMQVLYITNLYNYADGRLIDCLWSGFQLQRAKGAAFTKFLVQMVTGEKNAEDSKEARRNAFVNRMGGQQQGGTPVGKLTG